MVIQREKAKPSIPDVALALGAFRICDDAIHERLRDLAKSYHEPAVSIEELRNEFHKEMGTKKLSDEVRRMCDEE